MKLSAKTVLFCVLCLFGIGVNAQSSGTCGTNATWSYENGTLTISGTGAMYDYDLDIPWPKESLKAVVIGDSITTVGDNAFYQCASLQTISIGASVYSIGKAAFKFCSSLTSITLPDSLTSIGNDSFDECGLTSVTIPASVTSIGEYAFSMCPNLDTLSFADGSKLTSIGSDAFGRCTSLKSVTLPDSLKTISDYLFYGCTSLASVTLPANLESIGNNSFYYNTGLTSVTIPASVTTIGTDAFSVCDSLADMYVKWADPFTLPSSLSNSIFNHSNNSNLTLHVPYGKTTVYQSKGWQYPDNEYGFANIVEPNVVYVDNGGQQYESEFTGGPLTINDNFQKLISTKEVAGVDITYTRTFSSTSVWQAWYMPFDAAYTEMSAKYDVAQIMGVFMDAAGNTYITFQPMTEGTVKANTPYVVKPRTSGEVTLTIQNANLKLTKDTTFTIQSSAHNFTFGGVYEKTVNDTIDWYAINTEGNFQKLDAGVYLKPMRVWMTIADRDDNPYATPAPQQVRIRVLGDDTTGIGFIEETDAQQNIMYNLQGQQVGEGSKGILIINGKKYLR